MSYDIHMYAPVEKDVLGLNVTYNLRAMFVRALGVEGVKSLSGLSGKEALPWVERALQHMKDFPAIYEIMHPKNGWGNYDIAVQALTDILATCKIYPEGVIKIT